MLQDLLSGEYEGYAEIRGIQIIRAMKFRKASSKIEEEADRGMIKKEMHPMEEINASCSDHPDCILWKNARKLVSSCRFYIGDGDIVLSQYEIDGAYLYQDRPVTKVTVTIYELHHDGPSST